MKRKAKDLTKSQKIETLDALYTAVSSIRGRDVVKLFLRDLLTESERIMLGRRIIIARKLLEGQSLREIAAELKTGFDTVWRVQLWLSDQLPGYENAIKEMKKEFTKRERKREVGTLGTFAYLKKRYPLHFLLIPYSKRW